MAPEKRSEIVEALESSREEFRSAVNGLSEDGAKVRPAPERWSVLECIEHVIVVEQRFLSRLDETPAFEPPPPNPQKEAELATRAADRASRAQAPEVVHPSGRFTTLAQALETFSAVRDRSVRLARERGERVYSAAWEHPRFGKLNGGELLVLIASHARRHAAQIRETRATIRQ